MVIDYSKWSKIEVSDDEDDTHPNIDTGSLFRWRHKARVERMENLKSQRDALERKKQFNRERFEKLSADNSSKAELEQLTKEFDELLVEEAELMKQEKSQPLNVDTLSRDGFDSSKIVGYQSKPEQQQKSEEDQFSNLSEFVSKYKKEIQQFGMMSDLADSREYLTKNLELVSDHTSGYLCIWSIDLAVEEKWALFNVVTHQAICMQFLLELKKSISVPKFNLVDNFYKRLNRPPPEYQHAFDEELASFRERAKERAKIRIAEAINQQKQEENPTKVIGPGGLDAAEVFESLPEALQKCFESRDIDLLKKTIAGMSEEDARHHMDRCVRAGLWVPNGGQLDQLLPESEQEPDQPSCD